MKSDTELNTLDIKAEITCGMGYIVLISMFLIKLTEFFFHLH